MYRAIEKTNGEVFTFTHDQAFDELHRYGLVSEGIEEGEDAGLVADVHDAMCMLEEGQTLETDRFIISYKEN